MTKFFENKCKRLEAKVRRLEKKLQQSESDNRILSADKEHIRMRILSTQENFQLMRDDLHKIKSALYKYLKE